MVEWLALHEVCWFEPSGHLGLFCLKSKCSLCLCVGFPPGAQVFFPQYKNMHVNLWLQIGFRWERVSDMFKVGPVCRPVTAEMVSRDQRLHAWIHLINFLWYVFCPYLREWSVEKMKMVVTQGCNLLWSLIIMGSHCEGLYEFDFGFAVGDTLVFMPRDMPFY